MRRFVISPLQSGVLLLLSMPTLIAPVSVSPAIAQSRIYNPIAISPSTSVRDRLTKNDIPTGQGGFARDYVVQLQTGNQLAIDLTSESFDTIVYLIAIDGTTVAENDDGPDGSTNSLLFTRILQTGTYYIRVRSFGEMAGGEFTLKVTLLKPQ